MLLGTVESVNGLHQRSAFLTNLVLRAIVKDTEASMFPPILEAVAVGVVSGLLVDYLRPILGRVWLARKKNLACP